MPSPRPIDARRFVSAGGEQTEPFSTRDQRPVIRASGPCIGSLVELAVGILKPAGVGHEPAPF